MDLIFKLFLTAMLCMVCEGDVMVELTIESYSNPNGTCNTDSPGSDRKCCDGPQRVDCATGDTCDTYFDVCVGSIQSGWGCKGAFFQTKTFNNTNVINNLPVMLAESSGWGAGTLISVFVRDDDTNGTPAAQRREHIDTLINELTFNPAPVKDTATQQKIGWVGDTSLNLTLRAWCADDYYGKTCDTYCTGLDPVTQCDSNGNLVCQPSDTMLLEFLDPVNNTMVPDLIYGINSFFDMKVCHNNFTISYAKLHTDSNILSFNGLCWGRSVTPIEFESVLRLNSGELKNYFQPRVITGPAVITQGYGEHIIANVYVGVELKTLQNPDGTSFSGNSTNGSRRCCDVPRVDKCNLADDKCDLQASICIGELLNGVCIGAVTISPTYSNSTSLSTCGPALLDLTNHVAVPSHSMIGGFRLTKNTTTVQVIIKDSDLDGQAADIIDLLKKNITVTPGSDISNATSVDVVMNNIASVTLRLLFWCAPGHSGPLCHANNGIDKCQSGWYGDECEYQLNSCSPNPCKHNGVCTVLGPNNFNCTCDPGYTGSSCQQDVDECKLGVCQNNGTCLNTFGGFKCTCPSLWTGIICTDDKDPACDPNPCAHGSCSIDVTTPEHYKCTCDAGWTDTNCNSKIECSSVMCINGECRLENGINACICHPGYMGNSCDQVIDECLTKPCQNGGTCHNGVGNFTCDCAFGYGGHLCNEDISACHDVVCQNNGTCLDVGGGIYLCTCATGFTGDNCEIPLHTVCDSQTCKNNGICSSSKTGVICDCPSSWSGIYCQTDVNECVKADTCKNGGLCSNLPGSYNCDCPKGWNGDDCSIDQNECTGSSVLCKYGTCVNLPGTYKCNCDPEHTGPHCTTKLVHCLNQTCSDHGQCQERPDVYTCACDAGYTGSDCENDINECAANVCGSNSLNCSNSPGTYNCTCKIGWQGANCTEDINECDSTAVIPCSGNGFCTNSVGSYKCSCFPGFSGPDCSHFINTCKSVTCKNNGSCVVRNSETRCLCTSGWTGISCEDDVNECETETPCLHSGLCDNTDGSFDCRCLEGWSGNVCQSDVNECLTHVCENKAVCKNSLGSYLCACQTGWIGMNCEIKKIKSLQGSVFTFVFQRNISQDMIQPTITYTNLFLSKYLCGNITAQFLQVSISYNILKFKAQCKNSYITKDRITSTLHNIPNDTTIHLFPSPLIQVYENSTGPSSKPTPNKPWIAGHWPIVAGISGSVVVVIVVAAFVILRTRRRKTETNENESFTNPSYDVQYSDVQMHHYSKN